MKKISDFFTGKKTYIAGVGLILLAAIALWFGLVPVTECAAIAAGGFGLIGLGHKADRYGAMTVELIAIGKQIAEQQKVTGKADLKPLVEAVVADAIRLQSESDL